MGIDILEEQFETGAAGNGHQKPPETEQLSEGDEGEQGPGERQSNAETDNLGIDEPVLRPLDHPEDHQDQQGLFDGIEMDHSDDQREGEPHNGAKIGDDVAQAGKDPDDHRERETDQGQADGIQNTQDNHHDGLSSDIGRQNAVESM